MSRFYEIKNHIMSASDMDYVGICPSSVLEDEPNGHRPSDLLPSAKSVIIYGRKLIDGSVQAKFRQLEDKKPLALGSYSAHSFVLSINHLCMKETYDIAQYLEKTYKVMAMPLTNNVLQAVQPEGNYLPFFADPYKAGLPIHIYKAAAACGIGELGYNHRIITPDNGPRVYLCGILTDMEFEEYDKPYRGERICDPSKCHVCSDVCPTHALEKDQSYEMEICGKKYTLGKLDANGCAVACFGFRREFNPTTRAEIKEDHPDDETLKKALDRHFELPCIQTQDHLPMFHCDRCLIYCPAGSWKEKFEDPGLSKRMEAEK